MMLWRHLQYSKILTISATLLISVNKLPQMHNNVFTNFVWLDKSHHRESSARVNPTQSEPKWVMQDGFFLGFSIIWINLQVTEAVWM